MSFTRLFLIRHAEVEPRFQKVFGGRIDMDLSPLGHQQSETLAQFLLRQNLDVLYSSPMKRTRQTLAPFLPHLKAPPRFLDDLREVDFGDWTGLHWEEVRGRFQRSAFEWLHQIEMAAIPNAECPVAWRNRVQASLHHILNSHPAHTVGVLCHGGIIRMILSILLEIPLPHTATFEIEYASVTRVDHRPGRALLQFMNLAPWRDWPPAEGQGAVP